MNRPIPAYKGSESYVFVCYSHRDSEAVFDDLALLNRNGVNAWYDEGISAGGIWRAQIAEAIQGATKFLFFISEASLNSSHCLREVDFALNHDIEIIPIYLDNSKLPVELELVFNRVQALFRQSDAMYADHLLGAMRGSPRFASTIVAKKSRIVGIAVTVLTLVLGTAALVYWRHSEMAPADDSASERTIATPTAFDRYRDGLNLMERWDKGDNLDNAVVAFREAIKLNPDFALGFARLADALRIRYGLTGDKKWLNEATENAEEAVHLNDGLAPVQVALGRVQALQGNIDLAFAAIKRALSIDANDAVANQAMAMIYERLGRLGDSEASFQKAITLDPDNLSIRYSYADSLTRQGRYEDAIRQWQVVIRLAPDHYAALVNLGSALSASGDIPEAISMYQRAIDIRPTYMAYSNLGTAYSRGGRLQDAVDAYRKALEIDDTDWLAWGNLAYVYSWMDGKDKEATDSFEHAIRLAEAARDQNSRDSYVNSDLALYYAKTKQPDLALERLGTAIALAPNNGEILAAAAEAYEVMGQRDKAIEFIRKSLEAGVKPRQLQRNPELHELLADSRVKAML